VEQKVIGNSGVKEFAMGRIIYFASSLHSDKRRERNKLCASVLESFGHKVLLPQRHGIWEQMLKEEQEAGLPLDKATFNVKNRCWYNDLKDMNMADTCVLNADRIPSEGSCFEFGYMKAKGASCFILCEDDEVFDEINLMITYSGVRAQNMNELVEVLK
jgi:nucleoside 2-deoxyribosyltransferase